VVLVGEPETCAAWHREIAGRYRPSTITVDLSRVADAPAPLVKGDPPGTGAAAFVCHGAVCLPAIASLAEAVAAIDRPLR
jgi:uncharacterized protein YyaL (SSP411 family)